MRYCFLSVISIIVFISIGMFSTNLKVEKVENSDFLRLHIRANSNEEIDQNIKYQIKDNVLNYITEKVSKVSTKEEVENIFIKEKANLKKIIDEFLVNNNFDYESEIELTNEYFPTRMYNDIVVESGFYDAIIIKLGKAQGQNWWCVAYPPLCFYDYSENVNNIEYKSRLWQIIKLYFN